MTHYNEIMRTIDIMGEQGNAFVLIGYAKQWARQLDKDPEAIEQEMMSGDYINLLNVVEREFPFVELEGKEEYIEMYGEEE